MYGFNFISGSQFENITSSWSTEHEAQLFPLCQDAFAFSSYWHFLLTSNSKNRLGLNEKHVHPTTFPIHHFYQLQIHLNPITIHMASF